MFLADTNLLALVFRPRKCRKRLIFSAKSWISLDISWFSLSELHSQQPTPHTPTSGGNVKGYGCEALPRDVREGRGSDEARPRGTGVAPASLVVKCMRWRVIHSDTGAFGTAFAGPGKIPSGNLSHSDPF